MNANTKPTGAEQNICVHSRSFAALEFLSEWIYPPIAQIFTDLEAAAAGLNLRKSV